MKLSEIKQELAVHNIRLTKSLGQNFLHDANQLRRIVELADLRPTDRVLEVGPGLGPLTELLLAKAGAVLAIEKDLRLVQLLKTRFANSNSLQLMHADALEYLQRERRDWSGWKLVANLPYSVASPILIELAQAQHGPERMVATLQIEVARRLVAGSGRPDYGLLTLLVQLNYEPGEWFKIPASCFFPPPDVDSACLCLSKRKEPLLEADLHLAFDQLVKRSFSQRRKMMLKLLRADWHETRLTAAFARSGIPLQARAEHVHLRQFIELTRSLAPQASV